LGWLVAKTDVFPLRQLYSSIYSAGLAYLVGQLRPLPGLRGLYLSGSYAHGKHIHGASDIDFFILVDASQRQRLGALYRILQRSITLFPFLGPLKERWQQVVLVDPQGEVDNADLLFRHRLGLLRPLLEQHGFDLRGSVPWSQLQLSFLNLQLRLAHEAQQKGHAEPAFWQRRAQAVSELLAYQGQCPQVAPEWQGLLQAIERAAAAAVEGLPEVVVSASMPQEAPNDPQQIHRWGSFWVGRSDPEQRDFRSVGAVYSWQPLSFLGFAEPLLVLSRWEAPWLFGETTMPQEIWDWNRVQCRATLRSIAEQLLGGEKSLLESDWALLQALRASSMVQSLLADQPQPDSSALVQWLKGRFPEADDCLRHLTEYREALQRGQGRSYCQQLPANFSGFLVALTLAVLEQGPPPPASLLYQRLSLSLCVVTRDRPDWLRALLDTVVAQTRRPDEVLVVDNSPSQSARGVADAFVEQLPLRYLSEPRGKLGALRSLAIQQSTGEIICFTDDDCLLEPDWVAQAERSFLRDSRIGAVGGRVRHYSQDDSALDQFHRIYLG